MKTTVIPELETVKAALKAGTNGEVIALLQPLFSHCSVHEILPGICDAAEVAATCEDLQYAETTYRLAIHLYQNCFVADHASGLRAIKSLQNLLASQRRYIDLDVLNRNTRRSLSRATRHAESERTDGPMDYMRFCQGA